MPAKLIPRSKSSLSELAPWVLIMLAAAGPVSAQPGEAERVPSGEPIAATTAGQDELLLQVDVNAQGLDDTVLVLRAPDGRIFVPDENLDRWRLRRPEGPDRKSVV